jgi:peptide/nickel transport system substrate-binding protein
MGSSDPLKRAAWRQEITGIIQTEMPVIPLSWYDQVVAVSKRVQGVVIDPFEATYGIADMRWSQ